MTKTFVMLDTALNSDNLGDQIIMDAIEQQFPESKSAARIATHSYLNEEAIQLINDADYAILCGTNAISRNMEKSPWRLTSEDINSNYFDGKLILFGCGWAYYNKSEITEETANFLRRSLAQDVIHSVRDQFTVDKLHSIGIFNVINTNCPTMWDLKHQYNRSLKPNGAFDFALPAVFTLTDYRRDKIKDAQFVKFLSKHCRELYFWPQGRHDIEYLLNEFHTSHTENIEILKPSVEAFNEILELPDIRYYGTRLHAGIRALQKNVDAVIISIDNRAEQISKDTGLRVFDRNDFDFAASLVDEYVYSHRSFQNARQIKLNEANIQSFQNITLMKLNQIV